MYKIKNWTNYQHYGTRKNVPWIKLHFELLTSEMWMMLDDASRVLAITCMLLASRNNGEVKGTPEYIQKIASLNKKPNFKVLIDIGFLETLGDASILLANASPNVDKDKDKEEDKDKERLDPKSIIHIPQSVPVQGWLAFIEHRREIKKPLTARSQRACLKQLEDWALKGYKPGEIIEQSIRNGWQGLFLTKEQEKKHGKTGYGNILDAGIAANAGPDGGRETPIPVGYGQGDFRLLENLSND